MEGANANSDVDGASSNDQAVSPRKQEMFASAVEEDETRNHIVGDEADIDWTLLPPLPTPSEAKDKEYQCGAGILGGAAVMCFVAVISAYGSLDEQDDAGSIFFVSIVSFLCLLEMICLLAIYHKDPGVVKRSEATCYPIPPQVQPYIRSYIERHQQQSQQNQQDGKGSTQETIPMPSEPYITMESEGNEANGNEAADTYCVRCLVWRREKKKKYFHCNTCQRCVSHYDHHCNVFGRCIAGRPPCQGNLLIFYCAVAASGLLYASSALGLAWKLASGGFL